ncbi:(Fe-S)-binding protein [Paenibacillus psychroresistens]|uniref:(Fe-S)-binding protein n=1 Tax=Paenibacillus psychroresistens TaxID=1778678 RepID=A0A6B8RQS4_9BACL|nr:(Fe-S)-binding protein [Paenibacillus psychroresistens]QGQ98062.1 (Fe-S)-binding protein [Paenibacillus psychroresistens]
MLEDKRVALFVTCLVDSLSPDIGFAVLDVFNKLNIKLEVPMKQMCCGQPGYNVGYQKDSAKVALALYKEFKEYDYIVSPSGSCVSMIRNFYPDLLKSHLKKAEIEAFAEKFYELSEFIVDIAGIEQISGKLEKQVTYHSSCHMTRGLGAKSQALSLMSGIEGLELIPLPCGEECCGFGGMFSVKLPEMSTAMVDEKIKHISATGASTVISGDYSCLMNIQGRMNRTQKNIAAEHYIQTIAQGIAYEN